MTMVKKKIADSDVCVCGHEYRSHPLLMFGAGSPCKIETDTHYCDCRDFKKAKKK